MQMHILVQLFAHTVVTYTVPGYINTSFTHTNVQISKDSVHEYAIAVFVV
jgi:hypothetical protein